VLFLVILGLTLLQLRLRAVPIGRTAAPGRVG
jgi:hypothetical protein